MVGFCALEGHLHRGGPDAPQPAGTGEPGAQSGGTSQAGGAAEQAGAAGDPAAQAVELDHLWVVPERIGTGSAGSTSSAPGAARWSWAPRLEWDAEPGAVGFYERMGGRRIGTVVTNMGRGLPRMALNL